MRTEFLPLSPPLIGDAEIAEIVDSLGSDWITTGNKTEAFEDTVADLVEAPSPLAVSSCTDALNIGSSVRFIPIHMHPYYANKYYFTRDDFPAAVPEYERLVSLPSTTR